GGARALCQPRNPGRTWHLFRGYAGASRRRAPVHRPRGRFDDRRADRGRPAGDPRAAADRDRRPPGGQRARDRQGRRRAGDSPAQLHRQGAGQADPGACPASRNARERGSRSVELRPPESCKRPCRSRRELRRLADPGRDPGGQRGHRVRRHGIRGRRGAGFDRLGTSARRIGFTGAGDQFPPPARPELVEGCGSNGSASVKGVGTDIGVIHFVGIGGIGMSGIAEVMHNLGYTVQGSDIAEGASVDRLRARGIEVMIGHDAANLGNAAVVVTSTAVKRDNPEVAAALEARIPVVRRAEMLAELMRLKRTVAVAGTHGKTTTTSMVAALLDAGGIDPTVINGGIIESYGSNARLGQSEWMVVEADESDGSFLRLDGTYAVVTNIDPEHLDHYGSFDAVKEAFVEFIENVPFYGAAILCIDHPEVQKVIARVRDRRVITYGFSAQADWRAENIRSHEGGNLFDAIHTDRDGHRRTVSNVALPMPGRHNVQNALAAIAVAA